MSNNLDLRWSPTFCGASPGSKLFAKVIIGLQNSPLAGLRVKYPSTKPQYSNYWCSNYSRFTVHRLNRNYICFGSFCTHILVMSISYFGWFRTCINSPHNFKWLTATLMIYSLQKLSQLVKKCSSLGHNISDGPTKWQTDSYKPPLKLCMLGYNKSDAIFLK